MQANTSMNPSCVHNVNATDDGCALLRTNSTYNEDTRLETSTLNSLGRGCTLNRDGSYEMLIAQRKDGEDTKLDTNTFSKMQMSRQEYVPEKCIAFHWGRPLLSTAHIPGLEQRDYKQLTKHFPNLICTESVQFTTEKTKIRARPLRVGLVLSGGPAPGGHNVISGVYDYIKSVDSSSQLLGFKGGLDGLFHKDFIIVTDENLYKFRNSGGFDFLWSGRGKVSAEDLPKVLGTVKELILDGLIIVGGDGSNSNAALLAEFMSNHKDKVKCSVIGVPKTIDGDLKNEAIECSFGFDTAAKTYSEEVGNLCVDCTSSRGEWHFVRIMGRTASHLTLECALQTRPNLTFIGEEVQHKKQSLFDVVDEVASLMIERKAIGRDYGVILLNEGLIGFLYDVNVLIEELSSLTTSKMKVEDVPETLLCKGSQQLWKMFPMKIKEQLMCDREASGYVQVGKIATEKLLLEMVTAEMTKRGYHIHATHHYLGYEGRCAIPSIFDSNYCYNLGMTAGALIDNHQNGYMAAVRNLHLPVESWKPIGVPFTKLMHMQNIGGKILPAIIRALVSFDSPVFKVFAEVRDKWRMGDYYRSPGPIQFTGPAAHEIVFHVAVPQTTDLLCGTTEADTRVRGDGRFQVSTMLGCYSPLQRARLEYNPEIPSTCTDPAAKLAATSQYIPKDAFIKRHIEVNCYNLCTENRWRLQECQIELGHVAHTPTKQKIGIAILSRQTAGINNIIWGALDRARINGSTLIGFKHGVSGILDDDYFVISDEDVQLIKNQSGCGMLGRGREHNLLELSVKRRAFNKIVEHDLDGLILIGSTLAMTEAAYFADFVAFKRHKCAVVGIPATSGNNLLNSLVETSVGFDTSSKVYAALIGNVLADAASMPKYWHLIRLMGRQPSIEVLECALQTHPNFVVIAEEYGSGQKTIQDVASDIADVVCLRANEPGRCRNFGAVLIPDGLWNHLPTMNILLHEIDAVVMEAAEHGKQDEVRSDLLSSEDKSHGRWRSKLTAWSTAIWDTLPAYIKEQLLTTDPELRQNYLELDVLVADMVKDELARRKARGEYAGTFQSVTHYFGYQGRSSIPTNFDCSLGYTHGSVAVLAVEASLNGHLTTIRGLCGPVDEWRLGAIPMNCLMSVVHDRHESNLKDSTGKASGYSADTLNNIPVIPNSEAILTSKAFRALLSARRDWVSQDRFCNPGPIQFCGPLSCSINRMLIDQQLDYMKMRHAVLKYADLLKNACDFGVDETYLKYAFTTLHGLLNMRLNDSAIFEHMMESLNTTTPLNLMWSDEQ